MSDCPQFESNVQWMTEFEDFYYELPNLTPLHWEQHGLVDAKTLRSKRMSSHVDRKQLDHHRKTRAKWSYLSMIRYWTFGYKFHAVSTIFESLPPELESRFHVLLTSLEDKWRERMSCLLSLRPYSINDVRDSDLCANDQEAAMWQEESCAFLRVTYDANTQERKHVVLNNIHASLWGLSKNEMLRQFSNSELDIPMPALDFLYHLVYDLDHSLDDRVERYSRICTGRGADRKVHLVHTITMRSFNSSGQVTQETCLTREISSEEYDEAILHSRTKCPLLIMGDPRTGHELLNSKEDLDRTISDLRLSQEGTMALNHLGALIAERSVHLKQELLSLQVTSHNFFSSQPEGPEQKSQKLEAAYQLGSAPPDHHVVETFDPSLFIGPPPFTACDADTQPPLVSIQAAQCTSVERPLPYSTSMLPAGRHDPGPLQCAVKEGWAFTTILRYWTFGYNYESLSRLFDSVPPEVCTVYRRTLHDLQLACQSRMAHLAHVPAPPTFGPAPPCGGGGGVGDGDGREDWEAERLAEEAAMWEQQGVGGCAFLCVSFDPSSQARRHVVCNAAQPRFWGLHREELLARFAGRDLPLPTPELDFLYHLVYDLDHPLDTRLERYARVCAGGPGARRTALLVHMVSTKVFNSKGQVTQVTYLSRSITPEEYDAAVARTPQLCPLHLLGDRRSGRALLAEAEADADTPVSRLRQSYRGVLLFQNLADAIARRGSAAAAAAATAAAAAAGPDQGCSEASVSYVGPGHSEPSREDMLQWLGPGSPAGWDVRKRKRPDCEAATEPRLGWAPPPPSGGQGGLGGHPTG